MKMFVVITCAVLMAMVMTMGSVSGKLYVVGGKGKGKGAYWKPKYMNYTSDWAPYQHFGVEDDWLYFGFDKRMFSVYEVNRTNYESCSINDYITNITRGGRDVFRLTEVRSYYFIDGGGFCWSGMKLAIKPEDFGTKGTAPAPAPEKSSSNKSGSSSDPGVSIFLRIVIGIGVVMIGMGCFA